MLTFALIVAPALQLSGRAPASVPPALSMSASQSRRQLLKVGAVAALPVSSTPAFAEEFNRMAGVIEPFTEVQKGFKLYKPVAWNQFDADPGVFDVKWQDLIEPFESVSVSTSPVSTATSVTALGDLAVVGEKLAQSRKAELVSSTQGEVDGVITYTFELKGEAFHEYILLSVNRGKLYRLTTVSTNKRWPKRAEMYKNIVLSFVPKGF